MVARRSHAVAAFWVVLAVAGCAGAPDAPVASAPPMAGADDPAGDPALADLATRAGRGDVPAKRALGALSLQGIGVPLDPERGRLLLTEAATGGDGPAAAILGNAYRVGRSLPQDDAQALRWLKLASERGDASGEFGLASLYGSGHGVPTDMAEAVRLYRLSADQRYRQSQTQLGILSLFGRGVPRNYVAGYAWLDIAAVGAPPGEQSRLTNLRDLVGRTLSPSQLARAQDVARRWQPGIDIGAVTADHVLPEGDDPSPLPEEKLPLPKGTIEI